MKKIKSLISEVLRETNCDFQKLYYQLRMEESEDG